MSDSEYEEETMYVVFDTGTSVTKEFVEKASHNDGGCRIIGLEEGQPFLQLGDIVFEGEIDETVGTHLFFEIEERKADTSGLIPLLSSMRSTAEDGPKQQRLTVKYACQTENIIKCDPVSLKPKVDDASLVNISAPEENAEASMDFDAISTQAAKSDTNLESMDED